MQKREEELKFIGIFRVRVEMLLHIVAREYNIQFTDRTDMETTAIAMGRTGGWLLFLLAILAGRAAVTAAGLCCVAVSKTADQIMTTKCQQAQNVQYGQELPHNQKTNIGTILFKTGNSIGWSHRGSPRCFPGQSSGPNPT